jgi:hypothetical protein
MQARDWRRTNMTTPLKFSAESCSSLFKHGNGHWALCMELRRYAPEDPDMEEGYHLQDAYAFRMADWDLQHFGDRQMLLGEVMNFVKVAIYQLVGDVWGLKGKGK